MFNDLFICGCEDVSELAPAVRKKIDEFIEKRISIYTGNAEGTEQLVQEYILRDKNYRDKGYIRRMRKRWGRVDRLFSPGGFTDRYDKYDKM